MITLLEPSTATMQDATSAVIPTTEAFVRLGADQQSKLQAAIEHATHFLPSQGPISVFVHHNTLHSFEDMPFEQAVIEGGRRYGCEPYWPEQRYRSELARGRISAEDLRQVLMDDLDEEADELVASFGTRYTLRLAMLQMTLHSAPDAELKWLLAESDLLTRFRAEVSPQRAEQMVAKTRSWVMRHLDLTGQTAGAAAKGRASAGQSAERDGGDAGARLPDIVVSAVDRSRGQPIEWWSDAQWEAFTLDLLWHLSRHGVQSAGLPEIERRDPVRLRDLLWEVSGEDIDVCVNEVLIRFCGAFLDQGFSDWALPDRGLGFAQSFARLYQGSLAVTPKWMNGIVGELKAIQSEPFDPLVSIQQSLDALGIAEEETEEKIASTLLALRGWAGMIWQMETNTPFLQHPVRGGTLNEYLAIRLMLERYAIADFGERQYGTRDYREIRRIAETRLGVKRGPSTDERTYTIFQLAQAGGWTPEQLVFMTPGQWACLIREIETFDSVQRRRVLHAAYERHYRNATLDAIAIHSARRRQKRGDTKSGKPAYAAIFCIDDREESFRRHLEEVDPESVTASAAGFFAVAMYYQGVDHAHYRALCPAILTPQHFVREEPLFSARHVSAKRAERRRRIGWFTHQVHAHSRTMIGGWVTGVFGALATFPMVARILAPRLTSRIRETMGSFVKPPATELHLERTAAAPGPEPESLGYSLDEMAGIVIRILQDIGMVDNFPPIIVFFGHGSGSLNNPHESAYNCGACSGGRGGPNARAFAMMANDPRVRRLISGRGVELPDDVRFVGAFHNTCNDDVEYYDLDLLPRTHRSLFRRIEKSVNETRARNAHERARRFESAPLDLTAEEALEHVEERAEDLSQARPEYNHATNAVVTVGRRDWTRGLFMDRRVFLTEYDPAVDDESVSVLTRILQAAIPVCAGISLEYYFSTVDVEGYGCGSKLPHNVASMIGVMTGAASDLRPGLSQQMVEIHEPMRILFVIETSPEKMDKIMNENPGIERLIKGNWVQIALIDPETSTIMRYVNGTYQRYTPESSDLPVVASSADWYRGQRDHLGYASIEESS